MNEAQIKSEFWSVYHKMSVEILIQNLTDLKMQCLALHAELESLKQKKTE